MNGIDKKAGDMFSMIGSGIGEDLGYERTGEDLPVALERNVERLSDVEVEDVPEDEGIAIDDLETQLTAAVDDITDAMTTLRSEIVLGSPPRTYEVFSQLSASRIQAISELAKLRDMKRKAGREERKTKISERKQDLAEQKTKKSQNESGLLEGGGTTGITMTGKQLLELVKEARESHVRENEVRVEDAKVFEG